MCIYVCVCVCNGHAQLCAGLARGCLIGRLQVITCPSILLNCQIISSVTAAVVIVLSLLCRGHFYNSLKSPRLRHLLRQFTLMQRRTHFYSASVSLDFCIQGEFLKIRERKPVVNFVFLRGSVGVCHLDRKGKRLQLALTGC